MTTTEINLSEMSVEELRDIVKNHVFNKNKVINSAQIVSFYNKFEEIGIDELHNDAHFIKHLKIVAEELLNSQNERFLYEFIYPICKSGVGFYVIPSKEEEMLTMLLDKNCTDEELSKKIDKFKQDNCMSHLSFIEDELMLFYNVNELLLLNESESYFIS